MSALVGREREVAALDDALARAAVGERATVMLVGEPGIGKSRLLDALATRAAALKGRAAWGRCDEVGITPAFWPWLQVLRVLETDDDRAPNLTLDQRADASTRLQRFEDVVGFVCRRAERGLLVLVFDDVHAADLSSLQLLEYALPRFVGSRIAVALAARDRDASPAVQTALGRLQRGAIRLPLARLRREDVSALVGARISGEASARVWELSEGNPLFVEELVASIEAGSDARLPQVSSVRSVIRDRLDRLPPETAEAVVAAAVVGREFRAAIVADMLGTTDDDFARRIAPVVRLGIATPVSGDRHRFSHVLVAEVLADELDATSRARLHLRAAEALERRDADDRSAIAHHLLAAGHLAADAAVTAAEGAAMRAMAQLAFEDAAVLLERAMQALRLAAPGDRGRRARLLCAWAEAVHHTGDHVRGNALCDEAAAIARELRDHELLARTALVRGIEWRFGFPNPQLVEALREALPLLDAASRLRPKVLARLAAAEQPARDDPQRPVARALAAIELAAPLTDRDRLDVLYTATAALVDYVTPAVIEPILDETRRLALAAGERVIAIHTRVRLAFVVAERADRPELERIAEIIRREAPALGLARWIRTAHLLDAFLALLDGRFAEADEAASAAEAASQGDAQQLWLVSVHRVMAMINRGETPSMALRTAISTYTPARVVFDAWFAGYDRDPAAVRSALAQLDLATLEAELLGMIANAIAFAGTDEQAALAYARLAQRAPRPIYVASMLGSTVIELLDRIMLLLATRIGDWDAIDGYADAALGWAAKLASPVWIAKIRADHADALDARGRPGDRERAAELRRLALVDAERLGMRAFADRLTRASASSAPAAASATTSPPAIPSRPTDDAVTFTKQGELWLVHGFGEQVHVKDSRGMQMLARLLAEPTREIHVLDLAGRGAPGEAADGGDAGEVLDAKARAAYKARLADLLAERDEAESWGDRGRAERASTEIEALTSELERAIGLGGRARRVGSASERARSNVQRRVQHAIEQIRAASPRLGEHLAATVHTGTYCSYAPR